MVIPIYNMYKKGINAVLLALCLVLAGACMDEETFDTGAGDMLTFSIDTLRLDTVLAGVGTPTRSFMIYNRNSDGVSITDVGFADGRSNGFRVNVDGMYINEGLSRSIDCRKDDSLRVFVELTPEAFDSDLPVEISTELVFTLANGVRQSVVLSAWSQNVTVLSHVRIQTDTVLTARRPYLIYDSLTVEAGATLTIEAGAVFYFHSDAGLRVDGILRAIGERGKKIVMRGDRTDLMFVNQPYDRVPNQWVGMRFGSESYNNVLNYCDIHSAGDGIVCEASDVTQTKLRMENTVLHNMGGDGLRAVSSKIFVGNCQITNADGNCITIYGGDAEFIHCTVGQFYPFDGMRGSALVYSNELNGEPCPIERLYFRNCIISGYAEDEIFAHASTSGEGVAFNYGFFNCLLDTPEIVDDAQVAGCAWDRTGNAVVRDENFRDFNTAYLLYDFRLVEKSLAVGLGDATVTAQYYPEDMNGISRLADGQSDAGCYEYVAEE